VVEVRGRCSLGLGKALSCMCLFIPHFLARSLARSLDHSAALFCSSVRRTYCTPVKVTTQLLPALVHVVGGGAAVAAGTAKELLPSRLWDGLAKGVVSQ
jgi:hypothetical protein